jgi:hypothetical protein
VTCERVTNVSSAVVAAGDVIATSEAQQIRHVRRAGRPPRSATAVMPVISTPDQPSLFLGEYAPSRMSTRSRF